MRQYYQRLNHREHRENKNINKLEQIWDPPLCDLLIFSLVAPKYLRNCFGEHRGSMGTQRTGFSLTALSFSSYFLKILSLLSVLCGLFFIEHLPLSMRQ